jgi:molybdopterin synthase sulfur carrier subunit
VRLDVRYFASLADTTGCAKESVQLDAPADVAGLWRELVRRHPGLAQVAYRPLVACDQEYAEWDRGLDGVREVAFLPPVSGG